MRSVLSHWGSFHGWALSKGISPERISDHELVCLCWYWVARRVQDEETLRQIISELNESVVGSDDRGVWSRDSEMQMFMKG